MCYRRFVINEIKKDTTKPIFLYNLLCSSDLFSANPIYYFEKSNGVEICTNNLPQDFLNKYNCKDYNSAIEIIKQAIKNICKILNDFEKQNYLKKTDKKEILKINIGFEYEYKDILNNDDVINYVDYFNYEFVLTEEGKNHFSI